MDILVIAMNYSQIPYLNGEYIMWNEKAWSQDSVGFIAQFGRLADLGLEFAGPGETDWACGEVTPSPPLRGEGWALQLKGVWS